ncbi:MAG: hypothetical protein HYX20_03430 [Candidatus Yanofskybacteria bacterium]|nr:hypothetical protein [Candidatus Yanofskybacteria bacterium]
MQNALAIKINSCHRSIKAGITASFIAGAVFGAISGATGMLPTIARLLGGDSVIFGLMTNTLFSVVFGLFFAVFLGCKTTGKTKNIALGLAFSLVLWFLGPLIIMPWLLGIGSQLSKQGIQMALPSLWGHLVYGFILGLVYTAIAKNGKGVKSGIRFDRT